MKAGAIRSSPESIARLASRERADGSRVLVPHREIVGASLKAGRPLAVDWQLGCTDQGTFDSCTGHGFEKLVWGTAKAQDVAGERGDELGIYAMRAGDYLGSAATFPLPDDGAQPSTIADGIARFGVMASGLGPSVPSSRLTLLQLEQAIAYRVDQIAFVDQSGDTLIETLLDSLAAGIIPEFVMLVGADYASIGANVYNGTTATGLSLHSQALDGYRQGTNGYEFKAAGSWGTSFGINGQAWISQAFLATDAVDVYVANVAPTIRRAA